LGRRCKKVRGAEELVKGCVLVKKLFTTELFWGFVGEKYIPREDHQGAKKGSIWKKKKRTADHRVKKKGQIATKGGISGDRGFEGNTKRNLKQKKMGRKKGNNICGVHYILLIWFCIF